MKIGSRPRHHAKYSAAVRQSSSAFLQLAPSRERVTDRQVSCSDSEAMFFPLLTAIVMLGIGIGALRLNPRRSINQALAAVCFLSVLIFAAQLIAKFEGARYAVDHTSNPLPWIRLKFALIGVLSPLMVWVCYYLVSGRYDSRRDLLLKLLPWIALSGFLFCFAFTEGFRPNDSLPGHIRQGRFYYLYFLPMLAGQVAVCISAIIVARSLSGLRKLEFKFITISLGYLSLAAVLVETIYATWPDVPGIQPLTRVLSYLVYLVFGVGAWSVTSRRIYHSGQVVLSILERSLVVGVGCAMASFALRFFSEHEPDVFASATLIGLTFLILAYCDDKLRRWLRLHADNRKNALIGELHRAAEEEHDPEQLTKRFEHTLQVFADCSSVELLKFERTQYIGASSAIPVAVLREAGFLSDGWMSTAAFARMPSPAQASELHSVLTRARIAVLVCPRWATREPNLIAAFGERESRLPFTHPEIRLLRDLLNAADSLYTRSRLALQAQQADQLAAIGRLGLTILHEIRSPVSTLKSFSQLLPERIEDREFLKNFADVIPQEAERVEALAQQLLDLSKPRKYRLEKADIHPAIEETVVLWRARADEDRIRIVTRLSAARSVTMIDLDAIRQVIVNLLRNASEALAAGNHDRRIEVRTLNTEDQLWVEIEDNGPGLAQEARVRLFDAFVSTGKPTGVGLGLAICREIVSAHGGSITADLQRESGCVFRVALPIDVS